MASSTLLDIEQDIQWNNVLYLIKNKISFNLVIAIDKRFKNDFHFLDMGDKQGILTIPVNERFLNNLELVDILGETQIKTKIQITIENKEDIDTNINDREISLKLRKYDIISVILVDEVNKKTKVISNMSHYPLRPDLNKKSLIQQLIDESN